ncbi:MAG: aspartyl protease family protein [Reichenbachiella sp.]
MKKLITLTLILILLIQISYAQTIDTLTANYKGKPVVEMILNGKKTWVLLDTGSEISIFNVMAQKSYGFHAYESQHRQLSVSGFGSNQNNLLEVTNAKLYFGNVQLKSPFFAYDISNISKSIHARTGKYITAIIGTNTMRSYGFVIDLGNNKVSMAYKMKKKYLKPVKTESEIIIAKN